MTGLVNHPVKYEVQPSLTIQARGLCSSFSESDDSIKSATWILFRLRKGSDDIAFLLFIMNTLWMKSEHVVDIDLAERKNGGIKMSIGHLPGVERIQEDFEVVCKMGCTVPLFYQRK